MKNKKLFIPLLLLAALLSACGPTESTPPTAESQYSPDISTAIAQALTAAAQALTATVTPVNTPLPTSPPTLTPTRTPFPTIGITAITETLQSSPTAIPYIESCYNAAFVSDLTIKDDTVLMLGETFKKIWRIQNTGTCAWKEDFAMTFFSGTSMDGLTSPINQYVAPGKIAKISVPMTAPKTEGTYTGYWILSTSDGTKFGQVVYVRIITSKEETTEEPE
jgi:Ig-like domain from next to BRCA1 gene